MESIARQAEALKDEMVKRRRDLHRYPETCWTEFRTAGMIITELQALGYTVYFGADAVDGALMTGVPDEAKLKKCMERAIKEGADKKLVERMQGGKTGVVGILKGTKPGKTVAFRFDMDANDVEEEKTEKHRPFREGFVSAHVNVMHACGHDGHVTIGLALAKLLAENKEKLAGTVKLIFQPAEEGVHGARPMMEKGVVDDVDYFFGGHIGIKATGSESLVCMTGGFLATTKIAAVFKGVPSHAGMSPELGKNALLAAAQAAVSLNTIARHGKGASRINVGTLKAGTGLNVVPDIAVMELETRGATTEIDEYMAAAAERMLRASAELYDVEVNITRDGSAPNCTEDKDLALEAAGLAKEYGQYGHIIDYMDMDGSEDCTYFIERVRQRGGRAIYMMYGAELAAGHHNSSFDFDENCMWKTAGFLTVLALHYTNK